MKLSIIDEHMHFDALTDTMLKILQSSIRISQSTKNSCIEASKTTVLPISRPPSK
jgi:hypothetical protein